MKHLEPMNSAADQQEAETILLTTMSSIEGPFAFVFWHVSEHTVIKE
jgi:hypothetical protein